MSVVLRSHSCITDRASLEGARVDRAAYLFVMDERHERVQATYRDNYAQLGEEPLRPNEPLPRQPEH
jgi:hypothetical protein